MILLRQMGCRTKIESSCKLRLYLTAVYPYSVINYKKCTRVMGDVNSGNGVGLGWWGDVKGCTI